VPVRTTFTTRRGGVSSGPFAELNLAAHVGDDPSAVTDNRHRLADEMNVDRVVFMRQVHGVDVGIVAADTAAEVDSVDALVTDEPGVAIAVLVADCVPVVLAGARAVAVAHAGRRGTHHGVVGRAVAALRDLDDGPLRAWLGPSICGRCYEVPSRMQDEVAAVVPETRVTTNRGSTGLDLRAGVAAQLRAAGVADIHIDDTCTAEDPAYFSHRRDGLTGRFAGVALIQP
jgi:YfiH family protein